MKEKVLRLLPVASLMLLAVTVLGSLVLFLAYLGEVKSYEELYRDNVFAQSSRLLRVSTLLGRMFAAHPAEKFRRYEIVVSQSQLLQPYDVEMVFARLRDDPLLLKDRMLALQSRQDEHVKALAMLLERQKTAVDPAARAGLEQDFEEQARLFMNLIEERGSVLSQFEAVYFNQLRLNRLAEEKQLGLLTYIQIPMVLLTVVVILYYFRAQQIRVRTLRGMIPICSSCKKVRDDAGYWEQVEEYVRQHSEAEFTHGLCPECLRKLYPQYAE